MYDENIIRNANQISTKQNKKLEDLLKQKEERIVYLEKEIQQIKTYYESKDRHQ